MDDFFKLLNAIGKAWYDVRNDYEKENNNDEKKATSIRLGISSIIFSIIAAITIPLCIYGITACSGIQSIVIQIVAVICLIVTIIYLPLTFIFRGLLYCIYQFKLNKKAIRWVSLAVLIASVIASAFVTIFILGSLQ